MIEAIMPHDFVNLKNKELAKAELESILKRLQEAWHFTEGFALSVFEFEGQIEYEIDLPDGLGSLCLKNGFLHLCSGYKHYQYFFGTEINMWLRNMVYDVAYALGKDVVYVGDEYHFRDSDYATDWYSLDFSLQDWLAKYPEIPSYDDNLPVNPDEHVDWMALFKETFTCCKERRCFLEQRFSKYKILKVSALPGGYIVALNDKDELVLLNEQSGCELDCSQIDGINSDFNSAGFVLYKGKTCAFYTHDGRKKTDYKETRYEWRYDMHTVVVVDSETDKIVYRKLLY